MAFSTILHLFFGINEAATHVLSRLDYAGICFLIFGSVFPPYYYSFKCTPFLAYLYISILFVASSVVFVISMMPNIHQKQNMKLKGFMYSALGLFAAFPLCHLVYRTLNASPEEYFPFIRAMIWYMLMGFFYLSGMTIYVTKIPERFWPKRFDIWMNSHTIWHLFVFVAGVCHWFGCIDNYESRLVFPCPLE